MGFALALVLSASGLAQAAVTWDARFDMLGVSANNVTDFATRAQPGSGAGAIRAASTNQDRLSSMQHRILLGVSVKVLDDVKGRVTLRKNDRVYGNASQSVNGIEDSTFLDEAYMKAEKLGGLFDLTMGRQFYGEAGDIVAYFGPMNRYGLPVSALDAVRFDWAGEGERLFLTGLVGARNSSANTLAPDANGEEALYHAQLGYKGAQGVIKGYWWWQETMRRAAGVGAPPSGATAGGRNGHLHFFGLKGRWDREAFWLEGQAVQQLGVSRVQTALSSTDLRRYGRAFTAQAGARAGIFEPFARFGLGTGNNNDQATTHETEGFVSIAPDYTPGTICRLFAIGSAENQAAVGLGQAFGGSQGWECGAIGNRIVYGGGVKARPHRKITLTASAWSYNLHRDIRSAITLGVPASRGGGKRHIGHEYDFDATWKHSDTVELTAGAAHFEPGSFIKEYVQGTSANNIDNSNNSGRPNNPVNAAYFQFTLRWGK